MTATTTLDHFSVVSLMADLEQHQDSVFYFKYIADNKFSSPWKLESAVVKVATAGLRLAIKYGLGPNPKWQPGETITLWLENSLVTYCDLHDPMIVVMEDKPQTQSDSIDTDENLRSRLDKNLRGIFS